MIGFRLRVWVTCGQMDRRCEEGEECSVVFEKIVELSDLSYLGIMVSVQLSYRSKGMDELKIEGVELTVEFDC